MKHSANEEYEQMQRLLTMKAYVSGAGLLICLVMSFVLIGAMETLLLALFSVIPYTLGDLVGRATIVKLFKDAVLYAVEKQESEAAA